MDLNPRVSEKITEISEGLGRQLRPGIELDTSRLPALSTEPLRHWWGWFLQENL